jgi:hypothetical protein
VKDEESVGASRDLLGDKYGLECPAVAQRSPPVRFGEPVLRSSGGGLERASDSLGAASKPASAYSVGTHQQAERAFSRLRVVTAITVNRIRPTQ